MARTRTKPRQKNVPTAVVLFSIAGGMVGLSFAAVPLYQLFCQVTGFGGTPKVAAAPLPTLVTSEKIITVRFDANVSPALPWAFAPQQRQVQVRAGVPMQVNYKALNLSDGPVTGTATFNVTPYKAGKYFSKIECFCFTEQRLAGGQEALMGVQFFVDPEIFNDINTRDVKTITLSYTFFPAPEEKDSGGDNTAGRAQARPGKS
jgi:cytochrome c oxidase assembly protein subunit 11